MAGASVLSMTTVTSCARCAGSLLHCHGTVVRHEDGSVECTQPRCAGTAELHDFVIDCRDVQSRCCDDEPLAATG